MTPEASPPQCDAELDGLRCTLDRLHDEKYGTDHAHATPTSIHRWGPDGVTTQTWAIGQREPNNTPAGDCKQCGQPTAPGLYAYCSQACRRASDRDRGRLYRAQRREQAT